MGTIGRILKHLFVDERDARRAVPPAAISRLKALVQQSESTHSGEIRIYVEGSLPRSYLWHGQSARHRAVTLFGELRVWDTELNNGVLIYLLLAERRIEVIADRGLNVHMSAAAWKSMIDRMGASFRNGRYEEGLGQAVAEVSQLLVMYFPLAAGDAHRNELPDEPVVH
jgi:uncharacterized membrane protein